LEQRTVEQILVVSSHFPHLWQNALPIPPCGKSSENNLISISSSIVIWQFRFGKSHGLGGYPSPSRYSGIIELGEKLKIIYGAQLFADKILSGRELDR